MDGPDHRKKRQVADGPHSPPPPGAVDTPHTLTPHSADADRARRGHTPRISFIIVTIVPRVVSVSLSRRRSASNSSSRRYRRSRSRSLSRTSLRSRSCCRLCASGA